jgi:hypothetical protein
MALLNTTTVKLLLPASCVSEPFVAISSVSSVRGVSAAAIPPLVIVSAYASGDVSGVSIPELPPLFTSTDPTLWPAALV